MSERKILEWLYVNDVCCIDEVADGRYRIMGMGYEREDLTRAELLQLADEIRQLAGEDFDHG